MKKICFFLLLVPCSLFACNGPREKKQLTAAAIIAPADTVPESLYYLPMEDAQKILGQVAHMKDVEYEKEGNGYGKFKCTYTAIAPDPQSGKTGNLYYMLEQFPDSAGAKKEYAKIIGSNASMPGQTVLKNLGNEALLHTDGEHFYFLMVREKEKLLRLKVNQVTSSTSLQELKNVAAKIISAL